MKSILLYGRTRAGKSSQITEMAEYVKKTEGKLTRVYTADRGGVGPMQAHIDLGLIEVVAQESTDIWVFLNKAVRGYVRDAQGKWVPGKNENIGMFAFESLTAFADELMASMAKKASEGTSIGGGSNISFNVSGDGETLKVGGSNMAMYGVCQSRITSECWESQKLPASYVLWTASASKDEDQTAGGKVIGPAVVGKALTAEVPRWFQLCFRIDALPAQGGKPERHILYLGNNVDLASGNAVALGNTRVPLGSPELPSSIEPASLPKALEMIQNAEKTAKESIKKRLGL